MYCLMGLFVWIRSVVLVWFFLVVIVVYDCREIVLAVKTGLLNDTLIHCSTRFRKNLFVCFGVFHEQTKSSNQYILLFSLYPSIHVDYTSLNTI